MSEVRGKRLGGKGVMEERSRMKGYMEKTYSHMGIEGFELTSSEKISKSNLL